MDKLLDINEYRQYPLYGALYDLNEEMRKANMPAVTLNVCGGFAMMTYGLRDRKGITDVDYVGPKLVEEMEPLVYKAGRKHHLPADWINNDMVLAGFTFEDFEASTGKLHFTPAFRLSRLNINVLQPRDLLRLKILAVDTSLTAIDLGGEFTRTKDLPDIKKLIAFCGVSFEQAMAQNDDYIISTMTRPVIKAYLDGRDKDIDMMIKQAQAKYWTSFQKELAKDGTPEKDEEKSIPHDPAHSIVDRMVADARRRAYGAEKDDIDAVSRPRPDKEKDKETGRNTGKDAGRDSGRDEKRAGPDTGPDDR